jgi:hypothetical protein
MGTSYWFGGGGGGSIWDSGTAGNGGIGTNAFSTWMSATTSGVSGRIAGGGGGGGYWNEVSGIRPTGGTGGGANGSGRADSNGSQTATVNTGGGGSGSSDSPTANGSAGASGLVLIRYADTYSAAPTTTGSPTTVTSGGYRYYKFTGSGSITF